MRLEPAEFRLHEDEGKGFEHAMRAEPDEAVLRHLHRRLELRRVAVAELAVDAIGADDQVGVGEVRDVIDLALEHQFHAQCFGAVLQDVEQMLALDAAKTVAAGSDDAALEVDIDVVPMREAVEDFLRALWIGAFQVAQRLVGEHHAPAERVIGAVALDHGDAVRRIAPFHLDCEIKARRPTAHADDPHR